MKLIPVGKNAYAKVDDSNYEELSKYKWILMKNGYAARMLWNGKRTYTILMHRQIMQTSKGKQTDHINMNRLDNQTVNLRICNASQNAHHALARNTKRDGSKFKGVSLWGKRLYRARIHRFQIGYFAKEHYAALAYDLWAHYLDGEYAITNFKIIK